MLRSIFYSVLGGLLYASLSSSPALASEWGCKVLLCASNPAGWQTIPSCHPPMYKLIACRSGFNPCSFPTCPEGKTGEPGHVPFKACPGGWFPKHQDQDHANGEPSTCARQVSFNCNDGANGRDCTKTYQYRPRERNSKPYYFDIKSDSQNTVTRAWFNLSK